MARIATWATFCLLIAPLLKGQLQSNGPSLGTSILNGGLNECTRVRGPEDSGIPLPMVAITTTQKDPSALQEIIDYLNAVGLTDWKGMQATGVYLLSNGDSGTASLSIAGSDQERLDLTTSTATMSMRIDGRFGATIRADGKRSPMPQSTAKIGIVAFPRLFSANLATAVSAVIDQGQVNIDGVTLRRITVEEPVLVNGVLIEPNAPSVTDLYFDPSSHLLRISASLAQLDPTDREQYLVVIRYGDYQSSGTTLLPHSIGQTLNGQQQWVLNLTQIDLKSPADPSYFQF